MYEKLRQAINSGLFAEDLCEVVAPPSRVQLDEFCKIQGFRLSDEHRALLMEWGGSNLDEIRIHGLDQVSYSEGFVEFANDYNGYIFKYDEGGEVFAESTDGGDIRRLAESVDEFLNEVLMGEKGGDFYGQEWLQELREHGLV